MGSLIDLIGQKFGRLTVISRDEDSISKSGYKSVQWLCKCDCGNETIVIGRNLKQNNTKSCGCMQKEIVSKTNKKYNTYDLSGEYGICYMNNGKSFYFDLDDYDLIKDYCWCLDGDNRYVTTNINNKKVYLHKMIIKCGNDMEIDHINRNKLDNRKVNLRTATRSQNTMNRDIRPDNTSNIIGVNWNKKRNKWESRICLNNETIRLGYYDDFNDAIRARLLAEIEHYGEFAPQKHLYKQYGIEVE